MIHLFLVGVGLASGVGLGWFIWGWERKPAPLPLGAEPVAPLGADRYRIVLSTPNQIRARKIYERAQVAAKESVAFWDDGEQRGIRIGPSVSA